MTPKWLRALANDLCDIGAGLRELFGPWDPPPWPACEQPLVDGPDMLAETEAAQESHEPPPLATVDSADRAGAWPLSNAERLSNIRVDLQAMGHELNTADAEITRLLKENARLHRLLTERSQPK
jgi:hypothetical protein